MLVRGGAPAINGSLYVYAADTTIGGLMGEFSLQPGDRVIVVETWDYGPPANPRMSYVVESVCDRGRSVCLWGQRAALPARCVRRAEAQEHEKLG